MRNPAAWIGVLLAAAWAPAARAQDLDREFQKRREELQKRFDQQMKELEEWFRRQRREGGRAEPERPAPRRLEDFSPADREKVEKALALAREELDKLPDRLREAMKAVEAGMEAAREALKSLEGLPRDLAPGRRGREEGRRPPPSGDPRERARSLLERYFGGERGRREEFRGFPRDRLDELLERLRERRKKDPRDDP